MIPFQPRISIGIISDGGFGLAPQGRWDISASDDGIIYTPLEPDALMEVRGVTIGRNFHWQSKQTFHYLGSMRVLRREGSPSVLVNTLPMEQYLESVVSSEMAPDAPEEFIKAHTVISRSWALRKLEGGVGEGEGRVGKIAEPGRILDWDESSDHRGSGFDLCSDDHCQRYQGADCVTDKVRRAVKATEGLVLTDADGRIADARFSKCCGGHTELFSSCWEDRDLPYLTVRNDPYCDPAFARSRGFEPELRKALKGFDADCRYYTWTAEIGRDEVRRNLKEKFGRDVGEILGLEVERRSKAGRAVSLRITGSESSLSLGKELMIRRLLSPSHLYSSAIEIAPEAGGFRIKGRGWGHGVGLCQIGAAAMALAGYDAAQILGFYYPGTSLTKRY